MGTSSADVSLARVSVAIEYVVLMNERRRLCSDVCVSHAVDAAAAAAAAAAASDVVDDVRDGADRGRDDDERARRF